jgi:hypothetical protein
MRHILDIGYPILDIMVKTGKGWVKMREKNFKGLTIQINQSHHFNLMYNCSISERIHTVALKLVSRN